MTPAEARQRIVAGVVYSPHPGLHEDGEIVRVGDQYVFVLYRGDRTPKATLPEHLTFLSERAS